MNETLKEKKMEWMRRGQRIICLFMILQGMCICMESILGISIPMQFQILSAAGMVLVTELAGRNWKRMLAAITVILGMLSWIYIKYQDILRIAVKELANRTLELINDYYRTDFLYWYLDESPADYGWMALLLLFVLLGILEGALLVKSEKRRWHLQTMLLLPILMITAGLMVGKAASLPGILLILAGALAKMLDIRQRGVMLPAAGIVLSIMISFFISGNQSLLEQAENWHGDWQKKQLALEDKMLELLERVSDSSFFSKQDISLSNEEPEITGRKIFEITVDYPISQSFYIRGFVGGDYENGSWKSVSRQEFSDWAQQQGGNEQEYSRIVQNFPYEMLGFGSGMFYMPLGNRFQVSLKLTEKVQGHTLMPYFTQIPQEQPVKTDGAFPSGNSTEFEWDSYLKLLDSQIEMAGLPVLEAFLSDEREIKNCEIWTAYEEYVRETYTRLPSESLQDMKKYAKERRRREEHLYDTKMQELTDRIETEKEYEFSEEESELLLASDKKRVIQMVQNMLWENGRYSFDLQPVPEGEDFTEYFFFTQHKGYCVHFATAATLFFRMNDIPARFVSGYLVLPSDFKKNKDGTWTAEITDERAHAWTEVFEHNIGFHPVEATPPSYTEMLEEMEEEESLIQAVEQKEREEYGKETGQNDSQPENQQNSEKQPENGKTQTWGVTGTDGNSSGNNDNLRKFSTAVRVILAVICIFCLYLIIKYCRKRVLRKRLQRISLPDRTQAVREIGKEVRRKLRKKGYGRRDERTDREYQHMLESELPDFRWDEAFLIFQKAAFSKNGVTEEEYQTVLSLYQNLD